MATHYINNTLWSDSDATGTATAGGNDFILLKNATSQADNAFLNWGIYITGGTGADVITMSTTRNGGLFGQIIPNKLLAANYASGAQNVLSAHTIKNVRDYSNVKNTDQPNVYYAANRTDILRSVNSIFIYFCSSEN